MAESRQSLSTSNRSTHSCGPTDGASKGSALSGNKYKPLAKRSRVLSKKSVKQLRDSSMGIEVSLTALNSSDGSHKHLIAAENTTSSSNNYSDWELGLDARYQEEEVISIMNMLSYMDNERRGYGKGNDEACYKEERGADNSNRLYDEAARGLDLLEQGRMRKKIKRVTYTR